MSSNIAPPLTFSDTWLLLGPFQIGTREAAWGADPLEHHGGFHTLKPPDADSTHDFFASSLAFNGTVSWSTRPLELERRDDPDAVEAPLRVTFPEVDFAALRDVYGWAATQFQAWARAEFHLSGERARRVLLWTDGVLEFGVDGRQYFGGDFFVLRNAPTALWLDPGDHTVEVRLVRDVRSMGGVGEPEAAVMLGWEILPENTPLLAVETGVIPDFIEGRGFAGRFASVKVRNDHDEVIEIIRVTSNTVPITAEQTPKAPFAVAIGQTREIPFVITESGKGELRTTELEVLVEFRRPDSAQKENLRITARLPFVTRNISEAHKFTFRHPSGAVSYAILEPPEESAPDPTNSSSSQVLLNLHGAGLDVDSEEVRELFRDLKPLPFWLIHASGMTSWSGDDWHSWGYSDAETAVDAIDEWITVLKWKGPHASTSRYHVIGHSNGGQGVWYALTHRSDKILSAAAVSGYSHIESYVPYQFWSEMDTAIASTLNVARLSYRNDLLTDNFAGVPITQQHGSADDNVPPFHSRRLYQLATQGYSQKPRFLEMAAKGHWYEGVLKTDHLIEFYKSISDDSAPKAKLPLNYTVTAAPNGEVTRGYITVLQVHSPYQFGKVEVSQPGETQDEWSLSTSNVRCFSFKHDVKDDGRDMIVDGQNVKRSDQTGWNLLIQDDNGMWSCQPGGEAQTLPRQLTQLGGFDALLRTKDTIDVEVRHSLDLEVAQQIAQNLYQYFRADVEIGAQSEGHAGNKIRVLHGHVGEGSMKNLVADADHKAISFEVGGLKLRMSDGRVRRYSYRPGMGLYYLAPLDNGRVEIVVWGFDLAGLQRAARLFPSTTGIGQPDFVVLGAEAAFKGAGGVVAMGFFDHSWRIAAGSFLS